MKVLVFSDSHGALGLAEEMLRGESDCSLVFFLGDGMEEAEKMRDKYKDKKFILVKGNNDWYSHADTEAYKYIEANKNAGKEAKEKYGIELPDNIFDIYLKDILLRVLDQYWMKHIDDMQGLRQGVVLQSYAQTNPLEVYQKEGIAYDTGRNNHRAEVPCGQNVHSRSVHDNRRIATEESDGKVPSVYHYRFLRMAE